MLGPPATGSIYVKRAGATFFGASERDLTGLRFEL